MGVSYILITIIKLIINFFNWFLLVQGGSCIEGHCKFCAHITNGFWSNDPIQECKNITNFVHIFLMDFSLMTQSRKYTVHTTHIVYPVKKGFYALPLTQGGACVRLIHIWLEWPVQMSLSHGHITLFVTPIGVSGWIWINPFDRYHLCKCLCQPQRLCSTL